MDPCWYDYNGVSVFSSMAYEKVANLQKTSDYTVIRLTATHIIHRHQFIIQCSESNIFMTETT